MTCYHEGVCPYPDKSCRDCRYIHTQEEPDQPGGIKHDAGKVRLELVPPAAVMAIGRVMTYGAHKYGANNWQGVEIERYTGALLRHLYAWMGGEETDPESGMPHLWRVLTNAAFMTAFMTAIEGERERGT